MEDKKVDPIKAEAVRLVAQSHHVIGIIKVIIDLIQKSELAAVYEINGLEMKPVIMPDLEDVESSSFTKISVTSSMLVTSYDYPALKKCLSREVTISELQDKGEFTVDFYAGKLPGTSKKTYKINDPDVLKIAGKDIFIHFLKG